MNAPVYEAASRPIVAEASIVLGREQTQAHIDACNAVTLAIMRLKELYGPDFQEIALNIITAAVREK
jgi:hypothetical protein